MADSSDIGSDVRTYAREEAIVFRKTKEAFGGLSNMAAGFPLRVAGTDIRTLEALYQALRFPQDPELQRTIISERSPMTAKMRTKPHRARTRPDWDAIRVNLMRWCLRVKLAENWRSFGDLLLATGDRPIVEESKKDTFWGARPRGDGTLVGQNVLGRLLMELREELRTNRSALERVKPPNVPDFVLLGKEIGPLAVPVKTDSEDEPTLFTDVYGKEPEAADTTTVRPAMDPTQSYRKKLIEVALPLEAINAASAREKSIRHGHPSTLHLWWARRPLAACRAVLFASIVDDPSSRPDLFPTEEEQEAERQRLFRLIEELVKWESTTNETVLEAAREEIRKATDGNPPPVLDPFSGGGSIPLEAQRLGLEAYASDLNPVAVLITKALIEIPPKLAGKPPVNPESREKLAHGATWRGAQGLAEDVRYYGKWMRDQAFERIGHLYPKANLPDGGEATVIAWLWARTVKCPNPACGAVMPLVNGFTLSRRSSNPAYLVPRIESGNVCFDIARSNPQIEATVGRRGARCLVCNETAPLAHVRSEGLAGRMGRRLLALVSEGDRRRVYLPEDEAHVSAAQVPAPEAVPSTRLPDAALGFRVQGYGITTHDQLFTNRQLQALATFSELILEARERVVADGGAPEYADGVAAYLTLALGRLANRSSSQSFWNPNGEKVEQVFARNAIPMIWVYAEGNPFSESTGNWEGQVEYLVAALERVPARGVGFADQLDAAAIAPSPARHVVTDPPYYDNVPYADLSDFFYVWLRPTGSRIYPDLFSTLLVPKTQELIAEPARHGGAEAAARFFEDGLRQVFEGIRETQLDGYPTCVFYAFKQAETEGDGRASTGWETMLSGLLDAGFSITGTWPMRTEQSGGLREHGRNSLASSIVIVCRPRAVNAGVATRRDLVDALRNELPDSLRGLQHGNIAPVDLAQAAIGPGMGVFSRYAKVVEADGKPMAVRSALALVNQALDEILTEQEGDLDPDTRFAVTWFQQHGDGEGPFGEADVLARAKDTSVAGMQQAGVLVSRGGKVRILRRDELDPAWDPARDSRLTVWEVTQQMIRRLDGGGESHAAQLLARVGGLGEAARELAYRLYAVCEHKGWADEASRYNALVVAWPEIARLAAGSESTQERLDV